MSLQNYADTLLSYLLLLQGAPGLNGRPGVEGRKVPHWDSQDYLSILEFSWTHDAVCCSCYREDQEREEKRFIPFITLSLCSFDCFVRVVLKKQFLACKNQGNFTVCHMSYIWNCMLCEKERNNVQLEHHEHDVW